MRLAAYHLALLLLGHCSVPQWRPHMVHSLVFEIWSVDILLHVYIYIIYLYFVNHVPFSLSKVEINMKVKENALTITNTYMAEE